MFNQSIDSLININNIAFTYLYPVSNLNLLLQININNNNRYSGLFE